MNPKETADLFGFGHSDKPLTCGFTRPGPAIRELLSSLQVRRPAHERPPNRRDRVPAAQERTTTPARSGTKPPVGVPDFGGGGLLDSCCCSVLVPSFELDWCQHAKRGAATLPVVPDLEVFEDRVR